MSVLSRLLLVVICAGGIVGAAMPTHSQEAAACFTSAIALEERLAACTQLVESHDISVQVKNAAFLARTRLFYSQQKYDEAIADFASAIRSVADNSQAFQGRGLAYLRQGDCPSAISDFGEAVRLSPEFAAAYNNRGICFAQSGDGKRALDDYRTAIRLDPKYANAFYNRSILLGSMRRYDEAIADLTKASELQPTNAEIWNQLAWTLLRSGTTSRAMAYANRALELNPRLANAYDTRAAIYEAVGDVRNAVSDYEQAVRLDGTMSSSAQALERLSQAISSFVGEKAHSDANDLMARLLELVETRGWVSNLGRLCAALSLGDERDCKFKQFSVTSDETQGSTVYGINLREGPDQDRPTIIVFRLRALVGDFFSVSKSGALLAAYYRAGGVDFTPVSNDEARMALKEALAFWSANLAKVKEMAPAKSR